MERSEAEVPEWEFVKGEYPPWVKALSREIIGTFFPVVKLNGERPWTPGEIGAMAGHKLALMRGFEDAPPLKIKIPENAEFPKLDKE
jgi:hypothetical protein